MAITITITDKEVAAAGVNPEELGTPTTAEESAKDNEIKIKQQRRTQKNNSRSKEN